jgi:hypothetical protein
MRREDIPKLLGGYATGTLTAEERQALFEAALEDQELFDALAKEQALRELLEDPAARAHLLAALDDGPLPWPVGQALPPANWPRRFERWLWGHAMGLAAVACFLTVGGYVVWQARDRRPPTLIAEMERQSIEVHDSALPDRPAVGSQPRRAFDPGPGTKKPGPAMVEPGPPPVAVPHSPGPVNLPMAPMAPLPLPPAEASNQAAATAGTLRGETIAVRGAAPLFMAQTAPGSPSAPSPREPLPIGGRPAGGVAGGVLDAQALASIAAGRARGGLSFLEAGKSARELYDPALATPVLKSENAPAQASGGGGGGAARPRSQAEAAPAKLARADAATLPAASLGVRYQVLRRVAGGAFEVLPAGSGLAWGSAIKLRFIPNDSGYLSVFAAGGPTGLLQSRVARLAPVDTPEIRVDRPGPREFYALFTRDAQPPVNRANADAFRARVLQGASSVLSEAAGMEGVYEVNSAPGAPAGVPFVITLNFQ